MLHGSVRKDRSRSGDQAVWVFGLKKSPIVVECGSKMLHGTGIFTTR